MNENLQQATMDATAPKKKQPEVLFFFLGLVFIFSYLIYQYAYFSTPVSIETTGTTLNLEQEKLGNANISIEGKIKRYLFQDITVDLSLTITDHLGKEFAVHVDAPMHEWTYQGITQQSTMVSRYDANLGQYIINRLVFTPDFDQFIYQEKENERYYVIYPSEESTIAMLFQQFDNFNW